MALSGTEIFYVNGVQANGQLGATLLQTTTGAVAALASVGGTDTQTAITTVGAGVLTAAAITGGLIGRSGPVAAFTDTTDTAAAIATLGQVGGSFYFSVKNLTAFTQTIVGGTGVTIQASPVVPANSNATYLIVVNTATTATMYHVDTVPLTPQLFKATTALSTVGAGTITALGIASGVTVRSGSQSNTAFTDTTDTAVAIIAAQPNVHVGASWEWTYYNTTNATATVTGGVGVTVSTITTVPSNSWVRYLVTYTAAGTITLVGFEQAGPNTANGTFIANGTAAVVVADTNLTANSVVTFSVKTIGGTPSAAPFLSAVTAGTGFSVKAGTGDTSTYNYRIQG